MVFSVSFFTPKGLHIKAQGRASRTLGNDTRQTSLPRRGYTGGCVVRVAALCNPFGVKQNLARTVSPGCAAMRRPGGFDIRRPLRGKERNGKDHPDSPQVYSNLPLTFAFRSLGIAFRFSIRYNQPKLSSPHINPAGRLFRRESQFTGLLIPFQFSPSFPNPRRKLAAMARARERRHQQ